jgi:prepilin-type N-terminal cleavage/methylation domain-containing protein
MTRQRRVGAAGFTMLELLVSLLIFGTISGAVFSMVAQHQPVFNQQQNLAEVNIALRNAIAQMQLDVANAGANYYTGVNVPNYPVGLVVTNNVVASGGDCRSSGNYGATCFDSLSIITADANTPPANPWSLALGNITTSTATSGTNGTVYLSPAGSTTGYGIGATAPAAATAAAALYNAGDQILFVNNDGSQYTTAKLVSTTIPPPSQTFKIGNYWYVLLTYGTTNTNGTNTSTNDVYSMTTNLNSMLGTSYGSLNSNATDWVLRILPIQYKVDLTDPTNPVLTRTVAGLSQTLSQKTLATQIIGFKLGVSLHNNANDTDTTTYNFTASSYTDSGNAAAYNYTLARSLMVSLIGRTKPATDPTYVFRNTFDSGAYEIQGVSAVINPRNMSMTD